jgi:hypothetical protein
MRPSQHQKNTTDRVVYIDGVVEGVGVVVVGLSNSRGVLLVDFIIVCRGCGGMGGGTSLPVHQSCNIIDFGGSVVIFSSLQINLAKSTDMT